MTNPQSALIIVGVCDIVLLLIAAKSRSHIILNFVFRSATGTLLIYCINQIMTVSGISLTIGLGPMAVLTSGLLGFPGVILLYGIKIYGQL